MSTYAREYTVNVIWEITENLKKMWKQYQFNLWWCGSFHLKEVSDLIEEVLQVWSCILRYLSSLSSFVKRHLSLDLSHLRQIMGSWYLNRTQWIEILNFELDNPINFCEISKDKETNGGHLGKLTPFWNFQWLGPFSCMCPMETAHNTFWCLYHQLISYPLYQCCRVVETPVGNISNYLQQSCAFKYSQHRTSGHLY